jgi:hypothetical protein
MTRAFPLVPFLAWLVLLAGCRSSPTAPAAPPAPEAVESVATGSSAPPAAEPAPPATGFEGTWDTSFGTMKLAREGERFTGTYTYAAGATVEGTLEGRILRGTYHEPATRGGVRGRFAFELGEDVQSFRGTWAEGEGEALEPRERRAQRWSGRRVVGEPGRIWFIVLEENWEESLREPEYSFGAMLRSFFERVPAVGFRHRFIHDRADLERFCAEMAALVEPVVLYVSSHGSPEGLAIGSDGISPEVLGAALKPIGDLRLLHLGSCAVLAGDAPTRIRAAAGKDFPISGFVESVDWAASAIVDFTYMQLVLEQGLEPAAAVEATRRMLSFANEPGETGPLPGCDLEISLPTEP